MEGKLSNNKRKFMKGKENTELMLGVCLEDVIKDYGSNTGD